MAHPMENTEDLTRGDNDLSFESIVVKCPDYYYMRVILEFEASAPHLDAEMFKAIIVKALQELHGDAGASIVVDVLSFQSDSLEAILRVPSAGLVKVWSALTLFSKHGSAVCAFKVPKVSPHLVSLGVDSRQFADNLVNAPT